ncbi:MAG: hypothetical protein H0V20_02225 [Actinobacteria bacterium]|nr:hypothetical protein [Actinomycetota bacterium]
MKPRDLAIVAAVVLIGGLAAVDALRSGAGSDTGGRSTTRADGDRQVYGDTATASIDGNARGFPSVAAPGSLVFTDAHDRCRLREVSVGTGIEFPLPRIETTCQIWPAPTGARVAYGLPASALESVPSVTPFRLVDLNHTARDLGEFEARLDLVVWSADGQRAGWCEADRRGFDYEVGGELTSVALCPRGYTPGGTVASIEGRRIVARTRTVFTASGDIDYFSWGEDGSLALLLDGQRLERRRGERLLQSAEIPQLARGLTPIMAPDNCGALFPVAGGVVDVVNLCLEEDFDFFRGTAAAWSPDRRWVAVADDDEIVFYRVDGEIGVLRWSVTASTVAWR